MSVCVANHARFEFVGMIMLPDINRNALLESGSSENNENLSETTIPVAKTDLVVKGNICCY